MAKKTLYRLPFETDLRVMGVFCREKDYRLSWLINHLLGFELKRTLDFGFLSEKKEEQTQHSVFIYKQETMQRKFFLVNNRSNEGEGIFANPPALDYLLLVKADDSRFDYSDLLKKLRTIKQVTAAYLLDEALGKKKEAFLYDFEMYLAQNLKI